MCPDRHDALAHLGLRPVELSDRQVLDPYFASLRCPLSDYSFAQLYTWRESLGIRWTILRNHLCVFANGQDLTLLMPPIGDTGADAALADAFEVMDTYNAGHGVPDHSRVEYVSDEFLDRFDRTGLDVRPLTVDYLYDVQHMIDLPGSDLASKRQAKNRFLRLYESRVETFDASKHLKPCLELLDRWKQRQDAEHAPAATAIVDIGAAKRQKESVATRLSLEAAAELGLAGMVVYVKEGEGDSNPQSEIPSPQFPWILRGFTFGEPLGPDQSNICVEKTDLHIKGLAQFIFSEFCRTAWADRPFVNAGDDWGLETLAWTKRSYRPVKLLQKYVLRQPRAVQVAIPAQSAAEAA